MILKSFFFFFSTNSIKFNTTDDIFNVQIDEMCCFCWMVKLMTTFESLISRIYYYQGKSSVIILMCQKKECLMKNCNNKKSLASQCFGNQGCRILFIPQAIFYKMCPKNGKISNNKKRQTHWIKVFLLLIEFSSHFKSKFINKFTIPVGSQLYTLSLWSLISVTFVSAWSTRKKMQFLSNLMITIL